MVDFNLHSNIFYNESLNFDVPNYARVLIINSNGFSMAMCVGQTVLINVGIVL